MEGIFISYRREESAGYAGRLYDRLAAHFGSDKVFMDVEGIEPGVDFVQAIESAVTSCRVLILLIGDRWLNLTDSDGRRRLDDPNDFIRVETSTALQRNIRLVPVLLEGASMPRVDDLPKDLAGLSRRQAITVSHKQWEVTTGELIDALDRIFSPPGGDQADPGSQDVAPPASSQEVVKNESGKRRFGLWLGLGVTLAALILIVGLSRFRDTGPLETVDVQKSSPAQRQIDESVEVQQYKGEVSSGRSAPNLSPNPVMGGESDTVPDNVEEPAVTNVETAVAQETLTRPESTPEKADTSEQATEAVIQAEGVAGQKEGPVVDTLSKTGPALEGMKKSAQASGPETQPEEPAIQTLTKTRPVPEAIAKRESAAELVKTPESALPSPPPQLAAVPAVSAKQPVDSSPPPAAPAKDRTPPPPKASEHTSRPPRTAKSTVQGAARQPAPSPFPVRGDNWSYRVRGIWANVPERQVEISAASVDGGNIQESLVQTSTRSGTRRTGRLVAGSRVQIVHSGSTGNEFGPYLGSFKTLQTGEAWADVPTAESDPEWSGWHSSGSIGEPEQVTVPAGSFQALKVKVQSSRPVSGSSAERDREPVRIYYEIWFAPEVKRYVKMTRKILAASGQTIDRDTFELTGYRQN